jgi:hypothetical protein
MMEPIFYKYRSLENWKFVLDILLNGRLYAASFETLNDPMEGRYFYFEDDVTRQFKEAILNHKADWKICSLSKTRSNTLMWSYYAGGHRGVAVGVRVRRVRGRDFHFKEVRYDMEVHVGPGRDAAAVALDILTQKQLAWKHENEFRVFVRRPFVNVEIRELVFGCNISPADGDLLIRLARKCLPGVKIVKLEESDLDAPTTLSPGE